MVRLVILAFALLVTGCAQHMALPGDAPVVAITRLDEGSHSPAVAELLRQAEQARQGHRLQLAAGLLDQARQLEPRNPEILYRQAWLELKRSNSQQAESLSRRGLIFAEGNIELTRRLQELLAQSLDLQGRVMEATALRAQINAR